MVDPVGLNGLTAEQDSCFQVPLRVRGPSRSRAAEVLDRSFPRAWDGRLAYILSWVASPPFVLAIALGVVAGEQATPGAWTWSGLYVVLGVVAPVIYLLWLASTGRVTDLDVQLRRQRSRPLLFTLTCGALAVAVAVLGGAPPVLTALEIALGLETVLLFGITLRWKISVHCAAAASAATVIWVLTGVLWPLLIGVPLVAWSRVRLRRHTIAQTIAGALLGLVSTWLALTLAGRR